MVNEFVIIYSTTFHLFSKQFFEQIQKQKQKRNGKYLLYRLQYGDNRYKLVRLKKQYFFSFEKPLA